MMNVQLCPSLQRWERAQTKTLGGRLRTCLLYLLLFSAQNRLPDTRVLVHTFGWDVMILNIYFTYCGYGIIFDAGKNTVVKKPNEILKIFDTCEKLKENKNKQTRWLWMKLAQPGATYEQRWVPQPGWSLNTLICFQISDTRLLRGSNADARP